MTKWADERNGHGGAAIIARECPAERAAGQRRRFSRGRSAQGSGRGEGVGSAGGLTTPMPLPAATPPRLRRVLAACLQKDRRQRVRDIADVRLAMEGAFETTVGTLPMARARRRVSSGSDRSRWRSWGWAWSF